ncbi:MAG: tetratricopeptide repeat protein [Gemmatimonadetes bacterium]|nr:tetratricopeptide repeat protein [Gemmatimonadota bacterium]MBT7863507.1 tetratricopeptide repeat protein [Gemmatimonadota bacterium]
MRTWVGIVLAAGLLAYAVSAGNGFLAEDLRAIGSPVDGHVESYQQHGPGGLTGWFLTTQATLFGLRPVPFHAMGLLQHLAASLLLLWASRRWTDPVTAGLAAGLFAVWPSGSQAVFSIASGGELLSAALLLLAIRLATWPGRPALQAGAIALAGIAALQASVQALSLPLLLLLIHHRQRHRRLVGPHLASHLVAYGIALAWLLWHLPTWSASMALLDPLTNPLALQPTTSRILLALDGGWTYARLSFWPVSLSADYGFGVIDAAPSLATGVWAGVLLAGLVTIAWRYHRRGDLVSMGLLWWAAALLPMSNVVVPTAHALSEASLYLPMAGLCLSLAACVQALVAWVTPTLSRAPGSVTGRVTGCGPSGESGHASGHASGHSLGGWRSPVLWMGATLMLLAGSATARRGADWRTDETLWASTLLAAPTSARAHGALATALHARGVEIPAEQHYLKAISLYPRYVTAHYNLGLTLYAQGRWGDALAQFDRTCQLQPQHAAAHLNRGATLYRMGQWMPAADAYRQAAELRPVWWVPWLNLADALRAAGDEEAAAAAMQQARELGAVLPFD